jgi:L-threonylcarbamoyladenylate synthase
MCTPTSLIAPDEPGALADLAAAMRAGAVAAFPTDTVYGLGTDLASVAGIARIFALKGRAAEKALPVLIGSAGDLRLVAAQISEEARRLVDAFWPGPLTIVLARHIAVPEAVAPGSLTIGVRQPDNTIALALLRTLGAPMASSSANRSGVPPATEAQAVVEQFPVGLAGVIDGGLAPGGIASTVLDLTTPGRARLLRRGALAVTTLAGVLGYEPE